LAPFNGARPTEFSQLVKKRRVGETRGRRE
jgi:hypothetical protein